ncbi:MAG: protein translocase subunit SecD [Acidimicrobiales bacterium]|nr:protein translocase subunit SecD [Acidimicrobiales bacterium]
MKRNAWRPIIVLVVIVATMLGLTWRQEWKPLLGLDLQGGLSVVLTPTEETSQENLEVAINIIRSRIDAIGVAEPEITLQGQNILVQIPGVRDADQALELVGTTAEVRFRAVLQTLPPEAETTDGTTPGTTPDGTAGTTVPGDPTATTGDPTSEPSAVDPSATTTPTDAIEPTPSVDEQGMAAVEGESAAGMQDTPSTVTETVPPTTAAGPVAPSTTLDPALQQQLLEQQIASQAGQPGAGTNLPTTPPNEDTDEAQTVVLPQYDKPPGEPDRQVEVRYQLGPVLLTGEALQGASATINQSGEWAVNVRFKDGADGIDLFNAAAAQCKPPSATCPTGQLAITLDGAVISAPQIQPEQAAFTPFQADQITISGNFDEASARQLALVLNYGALPVALEVQQVQSVSATLGQDALDAALVSAAVALVLVTLFMVAFYRLLGLLAMAKLGLEMAILWAVISYLGSSQGLALTLAGITGIIVSIGVSVDSNIVYYEHLKEDIRNGRTRRSAVDKAFGSSFSTILKADGTSIIGAVLLWALSVGPVRGFAFFMGLFTVLDLIASYFFMRSTVAIAVRSKLCDRHPGWFGLPANDDERAVGRDARRRGTSPAMAGVGAEAPSATADDDGAVL